MDINVQPTKTETGRVAANKAAELMKDILARQKKLRFIAATGASQFDFLEHLCAIDGIDWERTEMFHLDEYVGVPESHPASFVGYLKQRLVNKVGIAQAHFVNGVAEDEEAERRRLSELISAEPIDVAFVGIGENGHLAFNDPPADFDTEEPYLVLPLDERCRAQQVGEGWFDEIGDVPARAYTMSVNQIMKSRSIIACVPDERKAEAVQRCLSAEAGITPEWPASILKRHDSCYVFLDQASASQLNT